MMSSVIKLEDQTTTSLQSRQKTVLTYLRKQIVDSFTRKVNKYAKQANSTISSIHTNPPQQQSPNLQQKEQKLIDPKLVNNYLRTKIKPNIKENLYSHQFWGDDYYHSVLRKARISEKMFVQCEPAELRKQMLAATGRGMPKNSRSLYTYSTPTLLSANSKAREALLLGFDDQHSKGQFKHKAKADEASPQSPVQAVAWAASQKGPNQSQAINKPSQASFKTDAKGTSQQPQNGSISSNNSKSDTKLIQNRVSLTKSQIFEITPKGSQSQQHHNPALDQRFQEQEESDKAEEDSALRIYEQRQADLRLGRQFNRQKQSKYSTATHTRPIRNSHTSQPKSSHRLHNNMLEGSDPKTHHQATNQFRQNTNPNNKQSLEETRYLLHHQSKSHQSLHNPSSTYSRNPKENEMAKLIIWQCNQAKNNTSLKNQIGAFSLFCKKFDKKLSRKSTHLTAEILNQ